MNRRTYMAFMTCLGLAIAAGCGGSEEEPEAQPGGAVGAACTMDSQCTGYENATCNSNLHPLEGFVEDNGEAANTALLSLTLPFPGGYCSTPLGSDCTSDAECGEGGGCFIPFEGVSEDVIAGIDATLPQLDVQLFSKRGLCLKQCEADSECRTDEGYECIVPLTAFMEVINPEYEKKYCMQFVDVSYLLMPGS